MYHGVHEYVYEICVLHCLYYWLYYWKIILIPSHLKKLSLALVAASSVLLTACDSNSSAQPSGDSEQSAESILQQHSELFSGCYTVSHDEPAQIKVSLQEQGLVMQMKEPKSAKRVWDNPEPLEVLPLDRVPNYFSIDKKNVTALIGRPDQLFVLAHVKEAYANIDPLLDSQYLGYILQGANTIYKVDCDDVATGEPISSSEQSEDMSRISITPVENVEPQ